MPNKKGAIDSIQYEEFHKDLPPGLTYIRLYFSGPLLLNKGYKDIGIFLKKTSDADYRYKLIVDPGDFLKFKIPEHILIKMKEWDYNVKAVNSRISSMEPFKRK